MIPKVTNRVEIECSKREKLFSFMIIGNYTSRKISFGFLAGRRMTEDRSLPKFDFNRAFRPVNQVTGKKVDNRIFFYFKSD